MPQLNSNPKDEKLRPVIDADIDNSRKKRNKFDIRNKIMLIPLVLVAVILLSSLTYLLVGNRKAIIDYAFNKDVTKQTEEDGGFWKFDLIKTSFAQAEEMINKIKPAIPFSKVAIEEIENLDSFIEEEGIEFSDEQKLALEEYGFFLAKNNIITDQSGYEDTDDFIQMYDEFDGNSNKYYRKQDDAIFITSDMALHLYHILIDRSFQKIEEAMFQPMLRAITRTLFLNSINKYNSTEDEKLKESYKRLSAYYLIPLVVIDSGSVSGEVDLKPEDFDTFAQYLDALNHKRIKNSEKEFMFSLNELEYDGIELSNEIYNLAKSELDLIGRADEVTISPIFTPLRREFVNDYTQFKPRSHYTKNDVLKSYFIAMMWYGRTGFALSSQDLTRDAVIMTGQINNLKTNGEDISKMWSDMASAIDFFVGEVDDLTAYDYTPLIKEVYGEDEITDSVFADDELLSIFVEKAKKELPAPKIISEVLDVYDDGGKRDELLEDTKQFRFMGQRFTPDAYIINNLTQGVGTPDPETGQRLPTMPTALMPMNVIAPENEIVQSYLDEWINDSERIRGQGRESDKIIAKIIGKLKEEFSSYAKNVWTQNIYWSWLDCFRSLLTEYGNGYPYFMQTDAWAKKNLTAVLGSYTELKHDTLLYAKQSYAERGGGGAEPPALPPVVRGYVEPDVEFWNKLLILAEKTQAGLEQRNILPQRFTHKYKKFIESVEFFKQISEQELQNQKISDDDFEKLRVINVHLRTITLPVDGELAQKDKRSGIIADIHTDAVKEKILYEATGKPYIIYVVVKDANGVRLTRGAVFSHYEFKEGLDERLSDEDWQAKVYDGQGQLPISDEWSLDIIK